MVARVTPEEGVTVWGSMQCPFYIHKALMVLLNSAGGKKFASHRWKTGGAFGGKEEYPSVIACHAALLAMKSGKPVKIIYDRAEDMARNYQAASLAHPVIVPRSRGMASLLAMDNRLPGRWWRLRYSFDGCALSRGTIHCRRGRTFLS